MPIPNHTSRKLKGQKQRGKAYTYTIFKSKPAKTLKKSRKKKNTLTTEEQEKASQQASLSNTQARKEWSKLFKVLKEKNYQLRILYSVKLSFKRKG